MKKKLCTTLLMLLPALLHGQPSAQPADSAAWVVDRYLQLLGIDDLPADSLTVIETTVTHVGGKDTTFMKRWYAPKGRLRVEIYEQGKLKRGLVSNGKDRTKRYLSSYEVWNAISREEFDERMPGYDFRGPLYDWRAKGAVLTWGGRTLLKGHPMQVVKVRMERMYDRYYMFDPESGLLTLIIESDELPQAYDKPVGPRVEWKSIHEYQPLANGMLPSLESFLRMEKEGGVATVMQSTVHFEPMDDAVFEKD